MKASHVFSVLLLAVALAGRARAAELPAHPVGWTDLSPIVDGKLDEPDWERAKPILAFTRWGSIATDNRDFRMIWSEQGLYFSAVIDDRDIRPHGKTHNDKLWQGDVIELFLKPDAKQSIYYEFEVNPDGRHVEFFIEKPGTPLEHLQAQDPLGMKSVVARTEKGWIVEAMIPWHVFIPTGGRPEEGDEWQFLVAYFDYDKLGKEPQLGASAPLSKPDFHLTREYGTLRFEPM